MSVASPVSFRAMLSSLPSFDLAVVPWEDARHISLTDIRRDHPGITTLAIVIGPEGGMSADEIRAMEEVGCLSVTLGPRILRTETAGLCAITAALCLYGDME